MRNLEENYTVKNKDGWMKSKNNIITHAAIARDLQESPTRFWSFKVILKYLKFYCQYSSLAGFKYLAEPQRTWFERFLWVTIHCVSIFSLIFIVYSSYQEFVMSPILTSMDSDRFPTTALDFPGIAICSINRISRQSAMKLATDIFNTNVTDLPVDEIVKLITQLGNLYASQFIMDEDRNVELDRLLKIYYGSNYDTGNVMKNLAPQCSVMLLTCKLHGTIRNCSQIFELRKTQDGFCCTFNYARESDDIPVLNDRIEPVEVYKVFDLGVERGLTVVMDPFLEDYLYPILPVVGWKVTVFNPRDYPDVSSGGVKEVLAKPGTETYVDVVATFFFSTKSISYYPAEKRKCIFPNEIQTLHGGTTYTYSDCIVDCKAHDIQNICGCRPFYYPRRGRSEYSTRVCNNADLKCLAKYKSKWWTVFPNAGNEAITDNKMWALHCHSCYPSCEDITYDVLSSKSYMQPGQYRTELLRNFNVTHQAILHVFFSKYGSMRLRQDVAYRWYELMSDIGGICGIFIGFSVISIVEFVYFIVLTFRDLLCEESSNRDNTQKNEIQSEPIQMIYWSELLPKSWQSAKCDKFAYNRHRY